MLGLLIVLSMGLVNVACSEHVRGSYVETVLTQSHQSLEKISSGRCQTTKCKRRRRKAKKKRGQRKRKQRKNKNRTKPKQDDRPEQTQIRDAVDTDKVDADRNDSAIADSSWAPSIAPTISIYPTLLDEDAATKVNSDGDSMMLSISSRPQYRCSSDLDNIPIGADQCNRPDCFYTGPNFGGVPGGNNSGDDFCAEGETCRYSPACVMQTPSFPPATMGQLQQQQQFGGNGGVGSGLQLSPGMSGMGPPPGLGLARTSAVAKQEEVLPEGQNEEVEEEEAHQTQPHIVPPATNKYLRRLN